MQNQNQTLAKCGKNYFSWVILLPLIVATIFCETGCVNSANQTTRKFPAINDYVKKRMSLFRDMRLTELRMEAVPSPKGGEIVVSGYIESQKTYDLLIQIFSSPTLNPSPAKIVWKVQVDPVRAPSHNMQ